MREKEESKEIFVKGERGPLLIPVQVVHRSLPTRTRQSRVSELGDAVGKTEQTVQPLLFLMVSCSSLSPQLGCKLLEMVLGSSLNTSMMPRQGLSTF